MTLIVAIPAENGVVFGSDGQVTTGVVRATGSKIQRLNDHSLWAASGELALIQRVAERIGGFPQRTQPLTAIRDTLAGFVKDAVQTLLTLDFRTQFFARDPKALLELHPGDFLFVEYKEKGEPRILHVLANGTSEWVEGRVAVTGSGDLFAHAVLAKYGRTPMTCDRAKLLAFKVIEEAIQVGAYGLGPPIDIWQIADGSGLKQADRDEITALEDAADALRQREVEMLLSEAPPAAAEPAPGGAEAGEPT